MFIFFWKNWFLTKCTVKSSMGELAIYACLMIYLAVSHCKTKSSNPVSTDRSDILCYTPKYDEFINYLMERVRTDLGMASNKLYSFENEEDMILFMKSQKADRILGVHFHTYTDPNITKPNLSYTIKAGHQLNISRTFFSNKKYEGPYYDDYARSGILNLKQVIDARYRKFIEPLDSSMSHIRAEASASTHSQKPCDTNEDKITTYGLIFLIIIKKILITLVLTPLVQEKENGTKDFIALSPSYAALDDLAFFSNIFLFIFIYIFGILLLSTPSYPLGEISYFDVYRLFAVYLLSDMAYTFMVSTFFDSVLYAKIGGILLHYVPLVLFSANESTLHKSSFMIGGNLFYLAIEIFHKYTVNVRNFGSGIGGGELYRIYLTLGFQSIVYIFLYFYLYAVIPGKGRKRQQFYFIIQPSFYFGEKEQHVKLLDEDSFDNKGIQIMNLTKIFKERCRNQKVVVDDINVTIETNCITTIIGPNDSGKTTLIKMILGYVSQTAGEIIVEGNKNPTKYRNIIGFSPERNVLLPYLTSTQNLTFFGCLKGADFENAEKNAETLLKRLKLFNKRLLPIEYLSDASQQKLSIGIALSGCTKFIIFDQPTSGLDIVSQREIWDILLELKKSKTILIATNDMEEAEILSDNIIVMSNGKVLQTTTALKLKYQYGCDYILKLDIEEDFNMQQTMSLITEFMPKAKVDTYSDTSIYIRMPYRYKSVYTNVLSKLEEMTYDLKISNISITNHFIDEAFVHSTKESGDEPEHSMAREIQQNKKQYNTLVDISTSQEHITTAISSREIMAIFYKKLIYIKREIFFSLFSIFIPLIGIGLAFIVINLHDPNELQPDCNIIGNKIFILSSEKLQNLQDAVIYDIRKSNGIPVLISENYVPENVGQNLEYKELKYNDGVFVVLQFYEDANGQFIRVMHTGKPQTCKSEKIVQIIKDTISKIPETRAKIIRVELIDLSKKNTGTPSKLQYYSLIVPVGWFLYILFYISLPYRETITSFEILQNISPLRYWPAFTLADIFLHIIVCVFTFLGQKMFDTIYSDAEQTTFMLSFMFYGFGYLPILYILAGAYFSLSTIIRVLNTIFIISAIFRINPYIVLNIVPDIGLQHQLRLINKYYLMHSRNETIIDMESYNTSILWFYGTLAVLFFGFSAILIFCCQTKSIVGAIYKEPLVTANDNVLAERKKVEDLIKENKQKNYALIVNNLVTPFQDKARFPVPSHSFAVRPGECFGIIGLNNSGKTRTIQQITGNLKIKIGKAYIYVTELHRDPNMYKFLTGYVMEVNALNDFMTPNETMKYFALLRGMNDNEIPRVIMNWMEKLDFTKFRNIPIKECSNATKRKLCMSIAMIGKPAVIFLDEPTKGVDPKSRNLMWKCIKEVQKENKAVILSTNKLDECEYLCDRIAVLHLGYIDNIGNIPQLKAKLAYGCILTIKLRNEHLQAEINLLTEQLSQVFAGYIINRPPLIRYFVSEQPVVWSSIFARMQTVSEQHENVIEDIYVKEVTIDGFFVNSPTITTTAPVENN